MPTPTIHQATQLIQSELRGVERDLAGFDVLKAQRDRLLDALKALQSFEGLTPDNARQAPPARTDFSLAVANLTAAARGVPSGPSEAALEVLRENGGIMHIKEIVAAIHTQGWFTDRDYEPLRATIIGTLNVWASSGRIEKTAPSTYRITSEKSKPQKVLGDV